MADIYKQFDSATASVGAYAILDPAGNYVARVVFKYPRDGAGRLYCYFQIWCAPMVRGYAGGYGYDKQSAAFDSAIERWSGGGDASGDASGAIDIWQAFNEARRAAGGERWSHTLESIGYRVLGVTG